METSSRSIRRAVLKSAALALTLAFTLAGAACNNSGGPGTDNTPGADLLVVLRNFTSTSRDMGLATGPLISVTGDVSNGTPRNYTVTNPGVGGSLDFIAVAGADTLSVTCPVTNATNVSESPEVVIQPAFNVLDCVSW